MGNHYEGEEDHVRVLQAVSELCPAYKLYLSHHTRNSIAAVLGCCEMAKRRYAGADQDGMMTELRRIEAATRHLMADLEKAGI